MQFKNKTKWDQQKQKATNQTCYEWVEYFATKAEEIPQDENYSKNIMELEEETDRNFGLSGSAWVWIFNTLKDHWASSEYYFIWKENEYPKIVKAKELAKEGTEFLYTLIKAKKTLGEERMLELLGKAGFEVKVISKV